MIKTTLSLALAALALAGTPTLPGPRPLPLKQQRVLVEYSPAAGEAVLRMEAESEQSLGQVELRDPLGEPLLRLWTAGDGRPALSVVRVETIESRPAALLAAFPEGAYELRARTTDGRMVQGRAALSHQLLGEPIVTYPGEGALNVPADGLHVTWVADPRASAYHLGLEQGESDGLVVELEPGTSEFTVPAGILRGGTETKLEVGAVGPTGNITLAEVTFTTR